jgi:hypothetical protein
MLIEFAASTTLAPKLRRRPADHLCQALQNLAQGHARFASHQERSWASATFSGTRHRLELLFEGAEAMEAGEHFIAELAEHEFTIPGQLVADAAVMEVDHIMLPAPRLAIAIEMLLLIDA